MPTFLIPLPNLIIFQFNPETMRHSFSQPLPRAQGAASQSAQTDPQAVSSAPTESYNFTLHLDANEMIASGSETQKDLAIGTGVSARLAALEMLQYPLPPKGTSLAAQLTGTVSAAANAGGAGLSLTAGAAGADKTPTAVPAQADVTLEVLTPPEIKGITPKAVKFIANAAYWYTQGERQLLAVADTAESVIGLIPIKGI